MKNKMSLSLLVGSITFIFYTSAFADQMYGIFMITKGSVKVNTFKGENTEAKVGMKVFEGDTIATALESRAKIVMSDRNVLNINPDTIMKISKYKNDTASDKKNVELNLLQGKVRTNVEQIYDGDKSKFLIKTPTAVAGVRGTQFLAGYNPSTGLTNIVTFKGAVTFSTVNPQGQVIGSPVVVKKGETTSAAPNTPPEAPKAIPKEELKKLDVETASTASAQKESAAASTAEPTAAGNQSTRESASEGNKTEQSTSGSRSAEPVAGSDSRSSASSTEASSAAAPSSMVDKKDLDIGQAREIKDVKAGANLPPPPPKPPMNTVTVPDSSRVREIIRDNTGKSKIIVTPEIKN